MPRGSSKVVYAALAANAAIAASKFFVAALTGSAAMMAESFHSSADTGNELLLLLGLKRSSRPADFQHPFGHGRELYFWAFVVAMSMFAIGGGLSVYEGIMRLVHPRHELADPTWNYVVLGAAGVFEGASWLVGLRELKRRCSPGETLIRVIHRSKDPSVFTVFIEDTAALVGLAIAFIGLFLSYRLNDPSPDAIASILIGVLLISAAAALAVETSGLLVGEGVDEDMRKALLHLIGADPAVRNVGNVLTMQLAPEEVLLVADVAFEPQLSTDQLERAVDRVESRIQHQYPSVKRVYFEAEALAAQSRRRPRHHPH
jgi:cation diffusion facilitator family transporter